jgi:hypothetical protein
MPTITSYHCGKCNAMLQIAQGVTQYSCPRCGARFDRSAVNAVVGLNRVWVTLGAGIFGAFAGFFVAIGRAAGDFHRPVRGWMWAGAISWALMAFASMAGRGDTAKPWYRVLFWSIFSGGVVLGFAVIKYHVRSDIQLVKLTITAMLVGAAIRSILGRVKREL